jgi:hypothetical protein
MSMLVIASRRSAASSAADRSENIAVSPWIA